MIPSALQSLAWWEVFLGGVCTIAIYSFLIKENPFYRSFEHLFIGIATAIGFFVTVRDFLWPEVLKPLMGLDRIPLPDGSYDTPYNKALLLLLIPMAFGSLYYFILVPRLSWLAQLVIGFTLGATAGLAFQGTTNFLLPQVKDSMRPIAGSGYSEHWGVYVSNLIFVVTLFLCLSYFFFTFRRKEGAGSGQLAQVSRFLMMGCFGVFFGTTIMARLALLVERVNFFINDWWPSLQKVWGGG